jgi:hypothetical protein
MKRIIIWVVFALVLSVHLFNRPLTENAQKNETLSIISQTQEVKEVVKSKYRLTHYFTGDPYGSGTCTASGLCIRHFKTNSKGWYTYQGKLVIATATYSYINKSKYGFQKHITYRNLFDELTLEIDGVEYEAIVLDICGYAHKEQRIDLFVSNKQSGIDRKVIYVSEV